MCRPLFLFVSSGCYGVPWRTRWRAPQRRRERRLRSWWRHERMSIAMALATVEHHSYGPTANDALRGQKTVTRAGEGEVREEHQALRGQTRLPPGMRPALLVEVQPAGACGGGTSRSIWPSLHRWCKFSMLLWPQVVDNVMDAFKFLDQPMTEQVIEVPRISCPPLSFSFSGSCPADSGTVGGSADCVVLFLTPAADCRADRRHSHWFTGRGGGARGGLHGLSQGQGSSAVSGAGNVDSPVPGRGGGARGGLHRPLPGTGLNSVLWCRQRRFSSSSRSWRWSSWRSSRPLPRDKVPTAGLWSTQRRFFSFFKVVAWCF